MQRDPFIIKELSIYKMPGFPSGMGTYRDLASNINIITGPNASGKSSTARVIQNIIWKGKGDGIRAGCSVVTGNSSWDIKIDSGRRVVQREGVNDDLPGVPSSEAAGRYMLAMHELVTAGENDIARQIIRESIGGYDLEEAQRKLEYSGTIKNKSAAEFRSFENAEDDYVKIEKSQKELKQQEGNLRELNRQKELAGKALKELAFFQEAEKYLAAKLKHDRLLSDFESYPEILGMMTGEEYDSVKNLEDEIKEARNEIDQAGAVSDRYREKLSSLNLPENGIGQAVAEELERRVEIIDRLERELEESEKKVAEYHAKAEEALRSIDRSADTKGWAGLDLKDVSGLDQFLQMLHKNLSEKQFFETRVAELESRVEKADPGVAKPDFGVDDPDSGVEKPDTNDQQKLREGLKILSNWLREENGSSGVRMIWVPVMIVAGIISALLALIYGPKGLTGLILPVIAGYLALQTRRQSNNDLRRKDYEKTGLRLPGEWDPDSVAVTMELLTSDLIESERAEEIRREVRHWRSLLGETNTRLNDIIRQGEVWKERLKLLPGFPGDDIRSYDGLYWFLNHALDWHRNNSEAEALKAGLDVISARLSDCLARFNSLLSNNDLKPAGNRIEARAVWSRLKQQISLWKEYSNIIQNKSEIIQSGIKRVEKASRAINDIYGKTGVETGNRELLRELTAKLPGFRQIRQEFFAAGVSLSDKHDELERDPLFKYYGGEIEDMDQEELQSRIDICRREADKLDHILSIIKETEINIKNVSRNRQLEEALRHMELSAQKLEDLFDNNLSSITGQLLVEHLKRETGEPDRNVVFNQANSYFKNITRGRYELRLQERDEPAFRAYDNVLKLGQNLEELSTGTRIQLLLSVRLAYIDSQETSLRLPVMADELLANSDDVRAGAIIGALVEISRQGRQVFYFTAQEDEVAKWRTLLEREKDISARFIEISGMDNEDAGSKPDRSVLKSFGLISKVPPPRDNDRQKYRDQIDVPQFDLLVDEPERLHVWYLVEDTSLLYNCLRSGIRFWGQLKTYLTAGKIAGMSDEILRQNEQKIDILTRFQELYRYGRPKPVDMDMIMASGVVTEKFFDAFAKKLGEAGNDPLKLISALRKGEILRFQKTRIDDLKNYLINKNIIKDEEVLEMEEIQVHINSYLATLDLATEEADAFLRTVLSPLQNRD